MLQKEIRIKIYLEFAHAAKEAKNKGEAAYADSIMEVVTSANMEEIERWKEDKKVCESLAIIMKPELD